MIDHLSIRVSDLKKSTAFYEQALKPLGYSRLPGDFDGAVAFKTKDVDDAYGAIWLSEQNAAEPLTQHIHIAFVATDIEMVKQFYDAAMNAGGRDNGVPGYCPEYGNNYYGAFVFDPDGNNVEAKFLE
jgi:catechol 2,3-dioxygenase-like lactoylglutathione lyase family enzyme